MKISRKSLRMIIESIINEAQAQALEFRLPGPGKVTGVALPSIKGRTTVLFRRSANARDRFAVVSPKPFKADGVEASKRGPNPFVTYEHYIIQTELGGSEKKIEIDPSSKKQKFRVKSYSSR